MNFWARRPIRENLIGLLIAVLAWLVQQLAIDAIFVAIGAHDAVRDRSALLPVLIASILATKLYDRMPLAWLGIGAHRWMGRELLLGAGIGAGIAVVAWLPAAISGSVSIIHDAPGALVATVLFSLLLGAAAEELIFRGYAFQRLVEIIGPAGATLAASAVFAAAHLGNPDISALALANIFLASVFFSLGYFATGSLWLPIAAHAAWNLTLALVVGLPVSGLDYSIGVLRTLDASPAIVGGGAFGPEGGLAGTVALALGIVALARLPAVGLSPYVHASVFASVYRRERERLRGRRER
jgi:membrane protease YdiL (CAAX protease family)